MLFERARNPGRVASSDHDETGFLTGFDLDARRGKTHLSGVVHRHDDGLRVALDLIGEQFFGVGAFDDVHHESNVHGRHRRAFRRVDARCFLSSRQPASLLAAPPAIAHDCHAMVIDADFEQLRLLLWNRQSFDVTEVEALGLYEANRQWVDPASMSERERQFFQDIVARHGGGVFNG